ncbi:MAG: hypothetical protein ACE5I8_08340 [Thermodesulfobacteriota bacterium]
MKKTSIARLILTVGLILVGFVMPGDSFGGETPRLTRSHSGGGVRVEATYLNPQDREAARFQVRMNTHSVNLDSYDLKALSLLRDETGKVYRATSAENQGGGHHRTVILYFPEVPAGIQNLELIIKGVAGVEERSFLWERSS